MLNVFKKKLRKSIHIASCNHSQCTINREKNVSPEYLRTNIVIDIKLLKYISSYTLY